MEYIVSTGGVEPPDFRTHLNYLSCIESLSNSLILTLGNKYQNRMNESKFLNKKLTLVRLTKEAIDGELNTIKGNNEYAELCVSWISVKSYYLFFNLVQILSYLMDGNELCLKQTHNENRKWLKNAILKNEIIFDSGVFNKILSSSKVTARKFCAGENLKKSNVDIVPRIIQVLKKMVDYQIQQLVFEKKIKNFRSNESKRIKSDFLEKETVCLCEFFYWYRIKANYRDLEFLNHEIPASSYVEYYDKYYKLTMNFYSALIDKINYLSNIRFGKKLL